MKQIYCRVIANNKFGYELIKCNVYKEYPDYQVSIIKYDDVYNIVDTKTGLKASGNFYKLKNAKSFMEHTEEQNFIEWYKAVERARNTVAYIQKIITVR